MRIDRADSEAELLGPPQYPIWEIAQVCCRRLPRPGESDRRRDRSGTGAALSHLRGGDGRPIRGPRWRAQYKATRPVSRGCDHLLVLDRRRGEGPVSNRRHLSPDPPLAADEKMGQLLFGCRVRHPQDRRLSRRGAGTRPFVPVFSDARNTATMQMLWRGIALYAHHYDIRIMFGCPSTPGTDPQPCHWRCPIFTTTILRRPRYGRVRCPSAT